MTIYWKRMYNKITLIVNEQIRTVNCVKHAYPIAFVRIPSTEQQHKKVITKRLCFVPSSIKRPQMSDHRITCGCDWPSTYTTLGPQWCANPEICSLAVERAILIYTYAHWCAAKMISCCRLSISIPRDTLFFLLHQVIQAKTRPYQHKRIYPTSPDRVRHLDAPHIHFDYMRRRHSVSHIQPYESYVVSRHSFCDVPLEFVY